MEDKINVKQALSEIGKLVKMFDSLKYAQNVLTVLSNQEAVEDDIIKSVAKLNQDKDKAVKEVVEVNEELNKLLERKQELIEEIKSSEKEFNDYSQRVVAEASAKAEGIVAEAEKQALSIKTEIEGLVTQTNQASAEKRRVEKELADLKDTVSSEKQRLKDLLGV